MSEQMRSEFEKAVRRDWLESMIDFTRNGDGYANRDVDNAYWAWKESRAALCVELPKEVAAGRWADDTGYFKDDVIEAIHAAGVKTK